MYTTLADDVSPRAAIYDRHTEESRWGKNKKSGTMLMAQQSYKNHLLF